MPLLARKRYLNLNHAGIYAPAGGGGALGLQTSLGSFFSLDNTLADATGAVTNLTNNNTVTFVSPPGGGLAAVTNCANFVGASSQSLSHADATGINVAAIDFSVSFWAYITSGGGETLVDRTTGGFGSREYRISETFTGGAAPVLLAINSSGTAATTANISRSAWHHIVVTYVNSSKAVIIYVDGSSAASATAAANTAGTNTLTLGSDGAAGGFLSGNMALFGTWRNRVLSAGDVTLLYNSGAGLSYAAMA